MLEISNSILEVIKNITNENGILVPARIHLYVTDELNKFLKENSLTLKELNYIVQHNLSDIPKCPICGKRIKNFSRNTKYCSVKCAQSDKLVQERKIKTNLEKYGVDYPAKLDEFKEKVKQTNLEKYGSEYYLSTDEFKERLKSTNLEKYGTECSLNNKEVNQKRLNTWIKKYNTTNPLKAKEIRKKIEKTSYERYGNKCFGGSDKHKNIMKEIYNDKIISGEIKDLVSKCSITKRKNFYDTCCNKLFNKNIEVISSKEDFINGNFPIKYKCLHCNEEFDLFTINPQKIFCKKCFDENISKGEKEIYNFIKSVYNKNIEQHNRTVLNGKELDIYIPDKNLAIEFNGDYWHSSERKDKNYHLEKTLECRSKGIRLIHIFEHEWDFKRPIVESILRNALGSIENRIYARKTIVKELTSKEYNSFLEENHIQGGINSSIKYGLFYNSELVSVIGFGKSRFKKGEIELHRFCSKLNTSVVGGFSKLISYSSIENFISYIDLSKFTGEGYVNIGFSIIDRTPPSYFYTKNGEVLSRYQCQKHKLSKLLENYDPSLSEIENMNMNNYIQIYDCGTLKVQYINRSIIGDKVYNEV